MPEPQTPEIVVKPVAQLDSTELRHLNAFLATSVDRTPYHCLAFSQLIDENFNVENYSLAAIGTEGSTLGYLPQWRVGNGLESVPWRDRGGPVTAFPAVGDAFIKYNSKILSENNLTGFVWKDFSHPSLAQTSHLRRATIQLKGLTRNSYWQSLSNRERGKIKASRRAGLRFEMLRNPPAQALEGFYQMFVETRHRLGVPAFKRKFFEDYFRLFPGENLALCQAVTDAEPLAALILIMTPQLAIDAYAASSDKGLQFKANDFLLFETICHCMELGLAEFDFGADSPKQRSLLKYKEKWFGKNAAHGRIQDVRDSYFGTVSFFDHNRFPYSIAKTVLRKLPRRLYLGASHWVVR